VDARSIRIAVDAPVRQAVRLAGSLMDGLLGLAAWLFVVTQVLGIFFALLIIPMCVIYVVVRSLRNR
jgi:hypothetical protein